MPNIEEVFAEYNRDPEAPKYNLARMRVLDIEEVAQAQGYTEAQKLRAIYLLGLVDGVTSAETQAKYNYA